MSLISGKLREALLLLSIICKCVVLCIQTKKCWSPLLVMTLQHRDMNATDRATLFSHKIFFYVVKGFPTPPTPVQLKRFHSQLAKALARIVLSLPILTELGVCVGEVE